MKNTDKLFLSGTFFTGCNYWASNAGTAMWHEFDAAVIEDDMRRLEEAGVRVMRMFPLWSDFQPLRMHCDGGNSGKELRLGEEPLPFTEEGRAGVDPVMADRFAQFCALAEKHNIRLLVGLVTGWMSGRTFAPEAFLGRKLLTDPLVIRWQVRFVRYMVRRFHTAPAIAAWDLGNECNCMQGGISQDEAFAWTNQIVSAIRREDTAHPILSGMHGLHPDGTWTPEDQGDALDVLCTHPYPLFTPYCDTDPINEMKSILHATAESVLYADLGGKPCFVEEAGTLGPMIAEESVAASYLRASMFSAWAHDLRGYVWWCANEQSHLEHTPYDWCAVERELGLFRADGTPKPVCDAMRDFTAYVDNFPEKTLPPYLSDAVCVLTEGQDTWAAAYGSYLLGKQAGLDLRFAWCLDQIPESRVYLLPSLSGLTSIPRRVMKELTEKVEAGAILYLSVNDALLSPFAELTGMKVVTRARQRHPAVVEIGGERCVLNSPICYQTVSVGAEVLSASEDGTPVLTAYRLGKGTVYFCAFPIEYAAAKEVGVISGADAVPYYRFYQTMDLRNPERICVSDTPFVGVTEHIKNENERILTVLNYTPGERTAQIALSDGYHLSKTYAAGGECRETGSGLSVTLPADTGLTVWVGREAETK